MATALKKLNFFIDNDICKEMESLVPAGRRSKVINEALKRELLRIKRQRVTERLRELKASGYLATDREIVEELRKSRKRI